MNRLPESLLPLTAFNQFILWRLEPRPGQRDAKIPVHSTGQPINAHDVSQHMGYPMAAELAVQAGPGIGVGFVFTGHDPFFFLDIDDCYVDGQWSPVSQWICGVFPEAAVEVSQSGTGLHIIGTGRTGPHGSKNKILGIDLYTAGRFVALTGTGARGSVGADYSIGLQAFARDYFPPTIGKSVSPEWTDFPVEGWRGSDVDKTVLDIALRSQSGKSAFGKAASFKNLWDGEIENFYPSHSEADLALAQHLAFYTGNNCERIKSLMEQSGLFRDKWTLRPEYLEGTILTAISRQSTFYTGGAPPTPVLLENLVVGDTREPTILSGSQIFNIDDQLTLFKGCTYVQDIHRVATPDGALLKSDQFKAVYGGREFVLDSVNSKLSSNAWEVFTESRGVRFPKVHGTCFRPLEKPGVILEEEGRTLVNTYVPIKTKSKAGDPARFLDHLIRVLPNARDQSILLAYMAACVQHIGVKFQWAPLLQGVEGNGKTLFTRCVANAVGRRYTHYPKAADIDNKFNGWLLGKLFIGVEDIYVPDHRREILETLKPMITGGDGLEIQLKGVDQITVDICANFILNSNHKDALVKTKNDRRFAIFFTHQQEADDLTRDGMSGNYFPDLYDWLRRDGYQIITQYLSQYEIPDELNPATQCHRAPATSSTDEAVIASLGPIEQEIIEAVEQERPGFAGGWISSMAVERLLADMGAKRRIPPNKRRDMLRRLGYEWHPGLHQGRVNNPTMLDMGKPRLFIKDGHLAGNLRQPQEILTAYSKAQDKS